MTRSSRSIALYAALAVLPTLGAGPARAEQATARRLTMAAAIELALARNPRLAIAAEDIAIAEARVRADSKLRLPLLGVRASALFWDRAIVAEIGGNRIDIRDRVTGSVDLTVVQPLSGALVIGKLVALDRAAALASRAQRDGARVDVAYQAAATYLEALQAAALVRIADGSLQQLDADQQHARALLQAGTLQQVDLLRLDAERARFEQQRLQAQTAALGARRRLALLVGLPDGTELALVEIDTTPPALPWTEDEAVARARRDRAEARAARAASDAADLGVSVSRAGYAPSVSLVGVLSHAVNAGSLGAANSGYIGVSLDWNVWDWGKRGAEVDGKRAASRQARLTQAALAEQLAVDARAQWQAARTAQATLDVAARGLAAAEEARRLQAVRFAQGAATTVELLDAETALAHARSQALIGRYQYLAAWMALAREVGAVAMQPQVP